MFQRTVVYLFFYLTFHGMQITSSSWCITGVEKFWHAKRCDQLVLGLRYKLTALKGVAENNSCTVN